MSRFDWRSAASYEEVLEFDAAGFAWEYLRRNPEYQAEYAGISGDGSTDADAMSAFRRKWALCFRG